jgi:hypothetical protein
MLAFIGTMENTKAAESGSNPAGGASTGQTTNGNGGANQDPSTIPNPKLGMAPLSSELAVAAASNNAPGESRQRPDRSAQDPFQSTDTQDTQTPMPPVIEDPQPVTASTESSQVPTQVPNVPVISEPERVSQTNEPISFPPSITVPPPNPVATVDQKEQSHVLDPNSPPSDPPPVNPPTNVDSHPPEADNAPKETS